MLHDSVECDLVDPETLMSSAFKVIVVQIVYKL